MNTNACIARDAHGRVVIPPLPTQVRRSPWRFASHPLLILGVALVGAQAMVTGGSWYLSDAFDGFLRPDRPRVADEVSSLVRADGSGCLVVVGSTLLSVDHDHMVTRVTVDVVSAPTTQDGVTGPCAPGDKGYVSGDVWSRWVSHGFRAG